MEDIIQAHQIFMFYYPAILVPTTILIYDHMATLTEEISCIWCRPKMLSAVLFLLNRYVALLGNVYGLIGYFLPVSLEVCPTYTLSRQVLIFSQTVIVCLILTLRTYALYGRSKRMLAFLVICILAFTGGAATETFGLYPITVTNLPKGGGCYQTYTAEATIRLGVAWVTLSVYELLIFVLTVIKIFKIRGLLRLSLTRSRRNIIDVMFQDGKCFATSVL
ncbi:uncharacterized protein BJ212DRAFT_1314099 [Suillus subaureus]|uniref:DUF6533 domain-containing protein n=1 Tax=Suillus subaureus TaxID=48587 RepID=A0A9P7ELC5_9AGAM|nr:uncharacterized protein BJ212DRAFT_1314099 [Suillus subaureus]KAG1825449.1 hypothetical protein BJ212DRAFT_1314099 [Suillus subaureus]